MKLKDWSYGSGNPCLIIGNVNTHEVNLIIYDEEEPTPTPCRYCELREEWKDETKRFDLSPRGVLIDKTFDELLKDSPNHTCKTEKGEG